MQSKISNYAILTRSLQILCKRLDCDFVDIPIEFDAQTQQPKYIDGKILLNDKITYIDTLSMVFSLYVNFLDSICGRNIGNIEFRNGITNYFVAMLRDFTVQYAGKMTRNTQEVISMRLDQFPLVWILLKNILCPYKNISLHNLQVVAQHCAYYDAAAFVEKDDKKFVYVNLDVEKNSVRSAFVLVESLRALCDDKDLPESIIRDVFSDFYLRERLLDFLGLALVEDEEIANFIGVLSVLCHSQDLENLALSLKKNVKIAQRNPYVGNWWFLGLTEKMLESVRGPDYTTTINLRDFSKELWEKVEKERKARGLVELPFEILLRLQSQDLKTPPNQTLQHLLDKVRIW